MASKKKAVFGIYPTRERAEAAVNRLIAGGFMENDVSVLMPDFASSREFAHEKHTKAPEGATTGAAAGGIVGGALGMMAGLGAITIPGIGPLVAAGPLLSALAGLGAGGAIGGLVGGLAGLGVPEYEAKRYEGRLKEGGILLSVHCNDSDAVDSAKIILKASGAEDISSTEESGVSARRDESRGSERRV